MHIRSRRPVLRIVDIDVDALAPQTLRVQAAALALPPRALDHRAPERRARAACGLKALGAFDGDRLIGFTYGIGADEPYTWREPVLQRLATAGRHAWTKDAFYVCELHVHPDYQRRGLGTRLLTTLCSRATERRVILTTPPQPTPARRLYHRHGYRDLLDTALDGHHDEPYAIMGARLPLLPPTFCAQAA